MDAYASLTVRDEPIGLEEGEKLGLQTVVNIARAREALHRSDTGGGLRKRSAVQPDDLRIRIHTLLSNIFGVRVPKST